MGSGASSHHRPQNNVVVFRADGDLSHLNREIVETLQVSKSEPLQVPVNIKRSSITLTETGNGVYTMRFIFDSLQNCLITVYYFGAEVVSQEMTTEYFTVYKKSDKQPQAFKFASGLGQSFPPNEIVLNLRQMTKKELSPASETKFPLILVIQTEDPALPYQSTFIKFDKHEGSCTHSVVKQKIHEPTQVWELWPVYNQAENGSSSECIICLERPACVTLMPCQHMCMCSPCGEHLGQAQVKKCPICRSLVKTIVNINA